MCGSLQNLIYLCKLGRTHAPVDRDRQWSIRLCSHGIYERPIRDGMHPHDRLPREAGTLRTRTMRPLSKSTWELPAPPWPVRIAYTDRVQDTPLGDSCSSMKAQSKVCCVALGQVQAVYGALPRTSGNQANVANAMTSFN